MRITAKKSGRLFKFVFFWGIKSKKKKVSSYVCWSKSQFKMKIAKNKCRKFFKVSAFLFWKLHKSKLMRNNRQLNY